MSKVELTKKWWNTNRPKDVKGAELERTLGMVEQTKDASRVAALAALPGAIAKVCKELDKKTDKELLKSLDALGALADAEKKKAEAALNAAIKAKAEADEKNKANEDDEKDTPDDKLFDPAFQLSMLKRAIRVPLLFAFAIASKPEDSAVVFHVRGNPKTLLRLAKTRSGAIKGCCGQAQAAENDPKLLTLSLDGPLVAGLARTMRKHFQANKITIFRKFRVLVDGQEVESDASDEELPAQVPGSQVSTAAAASPQEQVTRPPTAKQMEVLEDRRREFKKARAAWVAVKTKAEMDLELVKDGARMLYAADAKQFPKIVQGCKDIDAILDNLDDELRDTLDQYASTSLKNQTKLQALGATAKEILDRYHVYVENNQVMRAIDMKEFADVTIHAPIMKALGDLRKALS